MLGRSIPSLVLCWLSLAALAPAQGHFNTPHQGKVLPDSSPQLYLVDAAATGAGNGSSWADSFPHLQDALAVASKGDEIWVAAGTYTPSDTDATASFVLKKGVALYGGFAGTESDRGERDWLANETILSGDIGRDDVVSPWPSGWLINSSNCGHVLVASGTNRATVVDGFTVANGNTGPTGTPAGDELMFGSGIYIEAGSPTVRNCKFVHNLTAFASGGGIYCWDGDPLIEDCVFVQNYAHSGNGAGVYVYGDSTPEIRGDRFEGNITVSTSISGGDGNAGGLGLNCDNWITVEDCVFDLNTARSFFSVGGSLGYGGGLWVWNGGVSVLDCEFTRNQAHYGGGLWVWNGGVSVLDCEFTRNQAHYGAGMIAWGPATVVNSLFQNNTATVLPNDPYPEQGGEGAGVMIYSFSPDVVEVLDCTIAYNHGKKHVGLTSFSNGQIDVYNSIIWGNTGTSPEVLGWWPEQLNGNFSLAYTCVAMIFDPPAPGEDPLDPGDLPGCIDLDPLFVTPGSSGDLHLAAGSPCIDAGDNSAVPLGTTGDLDGAPRFADDPLTPDTGSGTAPIVDMGAYEVHP